MKEKQYDVALSFAGEDRHHAKRLAELLEAGGYSVFYDDFERAQLWGKDLYVHLSSVYKDQARYCVIFLSAHYARKSWTKHELQSAQARAFVEENREYILPVRLDDTEIPGILLTAGYLDLRSMTIEEIYQALVKKLSSNTSQPANADIPTSAAVESDSGEFALGEDSSKKHGNLFVQDPIHGLISLSQKELDLINTRAFQRLRRIRQLAMAFLVYPGALHTRFDHSIGVMHIAGRICERLKITDEECEQVRLAALLHDIGHGPFSQVSEHLLDKYVPKDGDSIREKIHGKITVDIIKNDSEIREILSDEERQFVVEMIEGKTTRDFRRDIVSSDLDADKMDYLLRDSHFAENKYGTYDLEKIIESCRVHYEENESYLAISDGGLYALEQLLLAKHHMTQQVYSHRIRSISDAMIVRGVELAIQEGNQEIKQLYQYTETSEFIENYMGYHDERLIDLLKRCDQEKARNIFDRLYSRKLFKMIGELPLKDVDDAIDRSQLLQMDDEQKRNREERIAEHLKIDPDDVIVNKLLIRNPNYGSRSYNLNPEAIMIFDEKQCKLKNLSSYATELILVSPPSDEVDLETVQVYAPPECWNRQQEELQLQDILLDL